MRGRAWRTRTGPPVLVLLALVGLGAPCARAADPIFNAATLHDFRIVMDPQDWSSLTRDFLSNQYYAANISVDGEVLQQVGIRSRGKGSRNGTKPGLLVDTNKYVSNQEFHGLKKLVLDNVVQDGSFLHEPLAYPVFEAMGIASPAISYTRVTVNDQYWGVYWLIENVDKNFLTARFGEKTGNLYKYEYVEDYRFTDKGSDPKAYAPLFKAESPDDPDMTALVQFIQAANNAPETGFAAAMAAYIDVDRFLTYIAVENAIAGQDGFLGLQGMNNFYIYQLAGQSKFVLIPWDQDTSYVSGTWPILQNVDTNVLSRKLMADPAKKQFYLGQVKAAAAKAVNPGFLTPKLEAYYGVMRNAVLEDTKKPFTNDEFELAVQGMRGVIGSRQADIQSQAP
jgi:spore coat protein CotH